MSSPNSDNYIIRLCEVLSVEDDNAGLRIKVRLEDSDADCPTMEDLPYCFPLLPKLIHVNPKVGECVFVILAEQGVAKGNRFFIGPLTAQQYDLNYSPFKYQSRCLLTGNNVAKPLPKPELNPENEGTVPDRDDVALQGRQNADVVLKDSELRLRCGFKQQPCGEPKNTLLFNREDMGFILMRYKRMQDHTGRDFASSINICADRINLISHDSRDEFTLNDPKDYITDDELRSILENAHPLPYGDTLIYFLQQMVDLFRNHSHPFPMMPPSFTQPQNEILAQNLEDMLSMSVRIN